MIGKFCPKNLREVHANSRYPEKIFPDSHQRESTEDEVSGKIESERCLKSFCPNQTPAML